jgi:hypothetical protein
VRASLFLFFLTSCRAALLCFRVHDCDWSGAAHHDLRVRLRDQNEANNSRSHTRSCTESAKEEEGPSPAMICCAVCTLLTSRLRVVVFLFFLSSSVRASVSGHRARECHQEYSRSLHKQTAAQHAHSCSLSPLLCFPQLLGASPSTHIDCWQTAFYTFFLPGLVRPSTHAATTDCRPQPQPQPGQQALYCSNNNNCF